MISRMVQELTNMIRPAMPLPETLLMIEGNARNWGHNTLTILSEHYRSCLDEVMSELEELLTPDWREAFEVAIRWAQWNLPRLTQESIDEAEAFIASKVVVEDQAVPPRPRPASPQGQEEPLQDVERRPPPPPRHPGKVQTKPQGSKVKTVATMTMGPQNDIGATTTSIPRRRKEVGRRGQQEDTGVSSSLSSERHSLAYGPPQIANSSDEEDELVFSPEEETSEPGAGPAPRAFGQRPLSPTRDADPGHGLDLPVVLKDFKAGRHLPRTHIITNRKLTEWNLVVEKKWIWMGDSNLSQLPAHSCKDLQIEAFPEGHFRHGQALLEKASPPEGFVVEKIVLSFGISSRENNVRETTIKNLQGAVRSAKRKFPYSEIWIPMVNYSKDLSTEEQLNLRTLNEHIQRNMGFIPPLPDHLFRTEEDKISWTVHTGKAMFSHWWRELSCRV